MILELPGTTTGQINKELVRVRREGGAVTLGRVMTLVIDADGADLEDAIDTANYASREHPCRIVVLAPRDDDDPRLDAEIRVGGDAGASEVVVLRPGGEMADHVDTLVIPLLLPDAPIVGWWPASVPDCCGTTGVGTMAARRITDTKGEPDPVATLKRLAKSYRPGSTDLAWTRLTRWRALLAAALEQVEDTEVTRVRIHGDLGSPSILLLGAWLQMALGCEFEATYSPEARGLESVVLDTAAGSIEIERADGHNATIRQPGQPDHQIALPPRTLNDCMAEELRRLDDDEIYGEVLGFFGANA